MEIYLLALVWYLVGFLSPIYCFIKMNESVFGVKKLQLDELIMSFFFGFFGLFSAISSWAYILKLKLEGVSNKTIWHE